jgi:hypothetical protein
MWTHENRPKYNRDHLRYPSDLTEDEWAYVEPLIPPAKPGGGKRRTDMRAVMNGVMYILSTGELAPSHELPSEEVHNLAHHWTTRVLCSGLEWAPEQSYSAAKPAAC